MISDSKLAVLHTPEEMEAAATLVNMSKCHFDHEEILVKMPLLEPPPPNPYMQAKPMMLPLLGALDKASLVDPTLSLSYIMRNQEAFIKKVTEVNHRVGNRAFKPAVLLEFFKSKHMPFRNDIYTITSTKWPFDREGRPKVEMVQAFNRLNYANGIYVLLADKIGLNWRIGRKFSRNRTAVVECRELMGASTLLA